MHRRTLLAGATALAATTLTACATGIPTPATVAQDVTLIATAFAAILPGFASIAGIGSATTATVGQAIVDLQAAAAAVSAADTTVSARPVVTRVATDVGAVIAVLTGLPLPAPIATVLEAAAVLLPVIEAAVGIVARAGTAPGSMTPAQARAALQTVTAAN